MNFSIAELVLDATQIITAHPNNIKKNANNYLQLIYFALLFFITNKNNKLECLGRSEAPMQYWEGKSALVAPTWRRQHEYE